ncbi:MAG: hypothetical protein GW748_04225 [Alphaproteobacteria bacterium]|nr:hypothetical protein [Alphaproteobacteria bacterium]NCQ66930.1 hypothetical protein [Alphaproteobacteria bacterium]NCT07497.1 hypothetical protein [Alphaproteobacteria bacterium]
MLKILLILFVFVVFPLGQADAAKQAIIQQYESQQRSTITGGGDTSGLQAEIEKLKNELKTAKGETIPELQKKIRELENASKTGGNTSGTGNTGGTTPITVEDPKTPINNATPPIVSNIPPPPGGNIPPPPPILGAKLPDGVTEEMEEIRKAFFDKYKLVAKKIKDGKYPPGLWEKVEDLTTHAKFQSKVDSEVKRAIDNYAVSKGLLDEFIKAYGEKKAGFNTHKDHLYKWFVYLTDFTIRAGKYKTLTWPVQPKGTLTDDLYWKLMLTLKGNYNLMLQDLKETLEKAEELARKAEEAEKAKTTTGKFLFALGDGNAVKKDIGRLFTVPLFRQKTIAHYGDLLMTAKTTDPDGQKTAEALFSWMFERLVLPFLPSDVSAISLQGNLRAAMIKAVQEKGIEDQAALEDYLKDQEKSKLLMKAMDDALKDVILANGIPAIKQGAKPLSIPTISNVQPEYEQILLFAVQEKLNAAVQAPLQKLLDEVLEKAPLSGGAQALEAKLLEILKAGLKTVFAEHQSITLQLKGESVGYDFWTWTKNFGNPNAPIIKTAQDRIKVLIETYQKDLLAFHGGTKTLPPFMQPITDFAYLESDIKVDDAFLTQYAKLILKGVDTVIKENKAEYSKIKDSNKQERELVLVGVEAVKSPMSKFLNIKDSKIAGSGNMRQEVQPYVDMLVAAHLLQD